MDNIAQRLGLVVHWVGSLLTVLCIVSSFIYNKDELTHLIGDSLYKSDVDNCKIFVKTIDRSTVKNGDCFIQEDYTGSRPLYDIAEGYGYDNQYRVKRDIEPSITQWILYSVNTMFDRWFLLIGIFCGWLIRYILSGKIHILPWK